jgi:hypothetical protein
MYAMCITIVSAAQNMTSSPAGRRSFSDSKVTFLDSKITCLDEASVAMSAGYPDVTDVRHSCVCPAHFGPPIGRLTSPSGRYSQRRKSG